MFARSITDLDMEWKLHHKTLLFSIISVQVFW